MRAGAPRITLGQASLASPRHANQDFHGARLPDGREGDLARTKGLVVALADGISSSEAGAVAAATAVRGFLEDYYLTSEAWPVRRAAQRVLEASNAWLHAQTRLGEGRFDADRGHVCSFSALVLKGREAHLLHVGDARVCRVHAQALEPLSSEHRLRLSASEQYLSRALGVAPAVEIDYRSWPLECGEHYLLATDGAWEHLAAADVQAALTRHPDDLDAACAALVAAAREHGSNDDATVQLLRIDTLPEPAQPVRDARREGLPPPPLLREGETFEGYTLHRLLHQGPRSQVWLAHDDDSGQPVALKLPASEVAGDAAALERFMLEEWVARRVDSPHLLRAAPASRPRQHLFVATEYVEGQTLAQWMVDHPRPGLDEVRGLLAQAAAGLQALHRKTMLHQDLRPENLMIDRGGTLRIIDFGATHVAGLAEGEAGAAAGMPALAGTLQYTAPEYFVGGAVDERAELFALAVLGYQMLTGALPYGLDIPRLRDARELHRLRYRPLRELRPDLPDWLDAVLRKALQPPPERRQQALSEFVHDLHAPGRAFTQAGRSALIERHPVAFWRASTLLLALLVLVQWAWMVLHPA